MPIQEVKTQWVNSLQVLKTRKITRQALVHQEFSIPKLLLCLSICKHKWDSSWYKKDLNRVYSQVSLDNNNSSSISNMNSFSMVAINFISRSNLTVLPYWVSLMNSLKVLCLVDWIKSSLWLVNSFSSSFTSSKRWLLDNMPKKSWWYNSSSTNSKWCNRLWWCNSKDRWTHININNCCLDHINRDPNSEIAE